MELSAIALIASAFILIITDMELEESTPILVGGGQFTEKDVAPERALSPMGIAAAAARAALSDTGIDDKLTALIHQPPPFANSIRPCRKPTTGGGPPHRR